ncbi:4-hydroxy-tetrahydrodipicolinate reductase [Alicyclobacillus ferrooxydans]|uniref:4-hydroxy-tetrahydrodipicolinate reductase n=1 Tax=Alicyclobacillus ferrooxydans TaxID=471514 RepID=A0A0P9F0N1_9BACL|nr:4-hydroxy-tetrahydrodipicolinate reductase [Alicyclobacillus ferrooxydans]KPV44890.1 hypothetical protein AN477_05070 [Alicyclobacillus ferrooxydans]
MNSSKIRVAIAGAAGKMGREAVTTFTGNDQFEVVGLLVRENGQADALLLSAGCPIFTNSDQLLTEVHPDIWIDFTDAESVQRHVDACITFGVRPVIGATGYGEDDLKRWDEACRTQEIGAIAAPNFALGALLMIRFAKEAARLFDSVEIIELHHDGKKDAPSGTAKRTAAAIMQERVEAAAELGSRQQLASFATGQAHEEDGARGYQLSGVPIHSIRLPGLVAHQEVIFGGSGETLTIRHDSVSRTSFMQGLQIACQRVMEIKGLVYGLENLLW